MSTTEPESDATTESALLVEGPVPDECTTKMCHNDPAYAVEMDAGTVSRRRGEPTYHEDPPDGAVSPYVCPTCRAERYPAVDDRQWRPIVEVATDGGLGALDRPRGVAEQIEYTQNRPWSTMGEHMAFVQARGSAAVGAVRAHEMDAQVRTRIGRFRPGFLRRWVDLVEFRSGARDTQREPIGEVELQYLRNGDYVALVAYPIRGSKAVVPAVANKLVSPSGDCLSDIDPFDVGRGAAAPDDEDSSDDPELVTDGGTDRLTVEDLTDEQIEAVLNSRGFQKMLAYSKLADGIGVLEDEDEIFESMVGTITAKHGSVRNESSVREVLRLFREEVETFTQPLVDEDGAELGSGDLEDLYVEEADR